MREAALPVQTAQGGGGPVRQVARRDAVPREAVQAEGGELPLQHRRRAQEDPRRRHAPRDHVHRLGEEVEVVGPSPSHSEGKGVAVPPAGPPRPLPEGRDLRRHGAEHQGGEVPYVYPHLQRRGAGQQVRVPGPPPLPPLEGRLQRRPLPLRQQPSVLGRIEAADIPGAVEPSVVVPPPIRLDHPSPARPPRAGHPGRKTSAPVEGRAALVAPKARNIAGHPQRRRLDPPGVLLPAPVARLHPSQQPRSLGRQGGQDDPPKIRRQRRHQGVPLPEALRRPDGEPVAPALRDDPVEVPAPPGRGEQRPPGHPAVGGHPADLLRGDHEGVPPAADVPVQRRMPDRPLPLHPLDQPRKEEEDLVIRRRFHPRELVHKRLAQQRRRAGQHIPVGGGRRHARLLQRPAYVAVQAELRVRLPPHPLRHHIHEVGAGGFTLLHQGETPPPGLVRRDEERDELLHRQAGGPVTRQPFRELLQGRAVASVGQKARHSRPQGEAVGTRPEETGVVRRVLHGVGEGQHLLVVVAARGHRLGDHHARQGRAPRADQRQTGGSSAEGAVPAGADPRLAALVSPGDVRVRHEHRQPPPLPAPGAGVADRLKRHALGAEHQRDPVHPPPLRARLRGEEKANFVAAAEEVAVEPLEVRDLHRAVPGGGDPSHRAAVPAVDRGQGAPPRLVLEVV
ncbi:MAG: hypothetical protein BWY99_02170 [Synergistetes bacterium ADurb.BinA166]|nr:MAG: hypothetical protein BWY99_02170 [Synergistetes bacterium ADurb.BinA166]